MRFWNEYREDVRRTYSGAPARRWHPALGPLTHPGLRAALLYRIAHRCQQRVWLRPAAALMKRLSRVLTGAEIHPAARIAGGLHLPHPIGIIIGPTVEISGAATIYQDVTIGNRSAEVEAHGPRLGPYTFVYPGARILGQLTIGARTQIGPNCVIYQDLPAGTTVLPPAPTILEGLSFTLRFKEKSERQEEVAV